MENCVVVGRGLHYGNAYEWALKLMETCYVVPELCRYRWTKNPVC